MVIWNEKKSFNLDNFEKNIEEDTNYQPLTKNNEKLISEILAKTKIWEN